MIPFNKPYVAGKEVVYLNQVITARKFSGNGVFTKKSQHFFEQKYNIKKALLTTSCTDALEMCAILLNIKEGDEVIMPSYTFVSTANAFVLRGAKIIFADSKKNHPNIDEQKIESLITKKTKAIVVVHYAGIACEMDTIMAIANKHNIFVVEDAAQAINSYYKEKPLGSIGHLGTFSFHDTKNIQCGEGGLLAINDNQFIDRAEVIWEKGTNRLAFFKGEVDKYGWVDIGSSFLPSELNAAFLWAQLESIKKIINRRKEIVKTYYKELKTLEEQHKIRLPFSPNYASSNGHMFYIICKSLKEREALISFLKESKISVVFHYLSLHKSEYYKDKNQIKNDLQFSDFFTDNLVRLPLYYDLKEENIIFISQKIKEFYREIKN